MPERGDPTPRSLASMPKKAWIAALCLSVLPVGCDRDAAVQPAAGSPSAATSASAANAPAPAPREKDDLIGRLQGCEIRHRGLLLDFGTRAARARRAFRSEPFEDTIDAEREGATVARVMVPRVSYELSLDEPHDEIEVSLRVRPGVARSVSASLGDRRLGSARLTGPDTRTVTFPVVKSPTAAGRYTLTLSFSGRPRGSTDALAEIDWVRLGAPDDGGGNYAAPTLRDIVTDAALDGVPRRAIALRAPASVRCPVLLSPDAQLRADLGFWGDGKGSLDVRIVADGVAPTVIAERKLVGGQGATWTPLNLNLKEYSGRVVALELRALETTRGGRVLFGDPAVVRAVEGTRVPEASTVVLFISAGTDRRLIPPWGPSAGMPALSELSRASAAFSVYRTPATVPAAVVGSLLTAESPPVHALEDPAARLPKVARVLGELLKEASGRSAMFTGAPSTFAAFGFDAGWDRYEAVSPVHDAPATQSITSATRWLGDELGAGEAGRRLLVIHARGAHPPWDVTREEAALLPPEEYGGALEPRRGGLILARLRAQRKQHKKLGDEDWVRLRALVTAGLAKQDIALGELIAMLKKKGKWDSTLFVFVGDVSPGAAPELPFDPAGELSEERLLVPLLVKFPGGKFAAKEVQTPVTAVDVAATVLRALHLRARESVDLFAAAEGFEPLLGRGLVASLGDRYTTRLGSWLLRGTLGKTPTLCQLDVDPSCVTDAFPSKPIAGWAAWQWTFDAFSDGTARRIAPREPASIDPDTGAALTVWGDI